MARRKARRSEAHAETELPATKEAQPVARPPTKPTRDDAIDTAARDGRRAVAAVGVVALVAVLYAWSLRWIADDAWISLRYARNLLLGEGLVWNPGERVEGYTNFLWTLLLAEGLSVGAPPRTLMLALGLASTFAMVLALGALWRTLTARRAVVPVALFATALNYSFASFGTSGLETPLVGALVAGLFLAAPLASEDADAPTRTRDAAVAGLLGTLALMTRPDAALACATVAVALALTPGSSRDRARVVGAFLLPFVVLYAPYFAWRAWYYGAALPNTFYAKAGGGANWATGLRYVWQFAGRYYLGVGVFILGARAVVGLARSERISPRVAALAAWIALHAVYVMRVGGDFMEGRFLVPVLPAFLLLVEVALRSLELPASIRATGFAAITLASVANVGQLAPATVVAGISDERTWEPAFNDWAREGAVFAKHLPPGTVIATDALGAFGWSAKDLVLVDTQGLTDAYVARLPMATRGRPGHDRSAPMDYLLQRGAVLLRDGTWLYDLGRRPDMVFAGNRYYLLRDDPTLRAAFEAVRNELAHP